MIRIALALILLAVPAPAQERRPSHCIAVAGGHLHHQPTAEQYAAIGRMDVVMVPVDGGYTMAVDSMIRVMRRMKASVILPMHWFTDTTPERFLRGMEDEGFVIERPGVSEVALSLRTLPERPTVIALRPGWLRDDE